MNYKTLTPGTSLNTPLGEAEFVKFKQNSNTQNIQVKFKISGKLFWYSEQQLRSVNRVESD